MEKFNLPKNIRPVVADYVNSVAAELASKNASNVVDDAALYMLASWLDVYMDAREGLKEGGLLDERDRLNPCFKAMHDAQNDCLKLFEKFGLTLKDRCRIPALDESDVEDNPLVEFLNKTKK